MKLGIEAMVQILLLAIGVLMLASVYITTLEASEAKQYHTWVMEKLEGAKYAQEVKEQCKKEAQQRKYQLSFSEETEDGHVLQKTTLKYNVGLPFLGEERQYEISGYSATLERR